MGSLDSSAINIVDKQNANFRNEGGAIVTTSGLLPQTGPTSQKVSTIHERDVQNRSLAELGTQTDEEKTQYSVVCAPPTKKVTTSDDATLEGGLIERHTNRLKPTATDQPEIALKPVSQRSTYNTGSKIVIRNSDNDGLVGRRDNTSFVPGP